MSMANKKKCIKNELKKRIEFKCKYLNKTANVKYISNIHLNLFFT